MVDLEKLRQALKKEIEEVEAERTALSDRYALLVARLRAAETLLGKEILPADNGIQPSTSGRSGSLIVGSASGAGLEFAQTSAYWIPILEALEELGGRSRTDEVLERVEKKMVGMLKPADFEILPSGISVRWRNRAQWQRKNMIDQGLLRGDSRRGVWEITADGRQWLLARKKKSA